MTTTTDELEDLAARRAAVDREARANAKSKKRLAWDLLKRTRNAEYVSLRYGYPLAMMQDALKKLEETETDVPKEITLRSGRTVDNPAVGGCGGFKRAGDVLPPAYNRQALATEEPPARAETDTVRDSAAEGPDPTAP